MARSSRISRLANTTFATVAAMVSIMVAPATIAQAVTPAPLSANAGEENTSAAAELTTGAAMRASTDIQIRRVKNLLVTKATDSDVAFEKLQRLQKQLRGQN